MPNITFTGAKRACTHACARGIGIGIAPRGLVERGVELVIPRVYLRALHQQSEGDVVVAVSTRQVQGRVLDASLRIEVGPLVDELRGEHATEYARSYSSNTTQPRSSVGHSYPPFLRRRLLRWLLTSYAEWVGQETRRLWFSTPLF